MVGFLIEATLKTTIINIADQRNYNVKDWAEGILIFSDEMEFRKAQCENFLRSKSTYDRKIHGRKCSVTELDKALAKKFLDDHHIQGSNNLGIIYFGMMFEGELIAVMSLGRHNRQISENRIVLDRFCIAFGIHIQGGASKLFSRCVDWAKKHNYDEIISFSDNRWTDGNIYKILGFTLEKNHKPDYCYVDVNNPTRRLSKQSQKKSACKCPKDMTEVEWAEARGLQRLWDKGKKRWVYSLNPSFTSWKEKLSAKCAEQNIEWSEKRSQQARDRAVRHYRNKIAVDKVEVYCNYCQTIHNPLRITYNKNIARNGKYICERYGGYLAGSKKKKKKENPYASLEQKLCNGCQSIKSFSEFYKDRNKSDGLATRCKACASNRA